ncbi:MAG: acetylornithine deacetylase [Parahaliea sp.]
MPTTEQQVIQELSTLIAMASVSSTDPGWDQGNRTVVEQLAEWLAAIGFTTEIINVSDDGNKANLVATLGSGSGGLVLAGHTDTVPFDEGRWHSDPLQLSERNQRLYGLGSTDMKGFFPLVIAAARHFAGRALREPLIVLATADEESSMNGARALAAAGWPKARAAIIGEPTNLTPVRMHKGIMMEAIRVTGRAGHSSNPALGNSALEVMHEVMGDLIYFRSELGQRFANPAFEVVAPTLNLGCIHGGDSPNRICGQSELHIDLRMTPDGDYRAVRDELDQRLAVIANRCEVEIVRSSLVEPVPPFAQDATSELVQVAERLSGKSALAVAFATEAPFLQQMGMETIVMGPGSIDRAHQPDEYLELNQLTPCIDLLERCIAHYCLGHR